MRLALVLLSLLEGVIFAATSFIVLKKRSIFPDTRIGLHMAQATQSEATWVYANTIAGKVCLIGACALLALAAVLFWTDFEKATALLLFFAVSVLAILAVLLLPTYLLRKKLHGSSSEKKQDVTENNPKKS